MSEFDHVEFWLVGFVNSDNKDSVSRAEVDTWHEAGTISYKGSSDDMVAVLEAADCFVLPSYYPEGTPRSLLEAAAMELPIITTNTPGCCDVVGGGLGVFCRPKDHGDLYQK